jgi:dTDP-4-dehydrorhamnose 3,5-epimerase
VTFTPLSLTGAHVIQLSLRHDHRGYSAQAWSAREFKARGLVDRVAEAGTSYNRKMGTLRGMHWQAAPHAQAKIVRCTRGSIYDVIIDLRRESATFCGWMAVTLSATAATLLYVPEGFAHGYQTLEDETEVSYLMSANYHPESEQGIRWNDPHFAITWPLPGVIVSEKDSCYRDFDA